MLFTEFWEERIDAYSSVIMKGLTGLPSFMTDMLMLQVGLILF